MAVSAAAPGPLDQPDPDPSDTLPKVAVFLFGAAVYAAVWVILLYIVGFVGNFFGPLKGSGLDMILTLKSIDMGVQEPFWHALLINVGLIVILGLQHSIMPRPWFKRWLTRVVPPHMERGVYIIFAMAALWLLMFQWRPITTPVWQIDIPFLRAVLNVIQVGGWVTVLVATAQVGHWKIFGVTQTLDYIRDKPYTRASYRHLPDEFYKAGWPVTAKGLWHYARHPDFFGFITAFWVTPSMTVGHLVFAIGLTLYILIGIFFLETNLKQLYGKPYEEYLRIRSKLIPWRPKQPAEKPSATAAPHEETGGP